MNPQHHPVRDFFRALPTEPTEEELAPLVSLLADTVSCTARPLASLKAYLRHNAGSLSQEVREQIADRVAADVASRRTTHPAGDSPHSAPVGDWYSGPRAAARLQMPWRTLRGRLHLAEHRRRYGYPRWDGYEWKFASLAIEPSTAASFAAALPDVEPLEELLPDWCIRAGHANPPRDAEDEGERRLLMRGADRAQAAVGGGGLT